MKNRKLLQPWFRLTALNQQIQADLHLPVIFFVGTDAYV